MAKLSTVTKLYLYLYTYKPSKHLDRRVNAALFHNVLNLTVQNSQIMKDIVCLYVSAMLISCLWLQDANATELPACINKKTGVWRIVANSKKCTAKKEDVVLINTSGKLGVQGLKGDQGTRGPKGDAGGINVYDANNQFLGSTISGGMISEEGNGSIDVFVAAPISAQVQISFSTGDVCDSKSCSGIDNTYDPAFQATNYPLIGESIPFMNSSQTLKFVSNDCSGAPLNATVYSQPRLMSKLLKGVGSASGKYYMYKVKTMASGAVTWSSSRYIYPGAPATCNPASLEVYTVAPTYELTEVTLPFTLPVALPLRIE